MHKLSLFLIVSLSCGLAFADDEKALEYYQEGLKLYQAGSSTLARGYFTKAVNERNKDGTVLVEVGGTEEWIESVRGMKKITINGEEQFFDYYPNRYITKIDAEFTEQLRLKNKSDAPPECIMVVEYQDKDANSILSQNDDAWLNVSIENIGKTDAEKTVFTINSNQADIKFNQDISIGTIAPNQKITRQIKLSAENILLDGKVKFTYKLSERDGYNAAPQILAINTGTIYPSKLMIAQAHVNIINDDKLQVAYTVSNKGKGVAKNVKVNLSAPNINGLMLAAGSSTQQTIATLAPYASQKITFDYIVKDNAKQGKDLNFELSIDDTENDKFLTKSVAFNTIKMYKEEPLDLNIPKGKGNNAHSIALIIGNQKYSSFSNVDYAHNDVAAVEKYLITLAGFKKENIITIKDMKSKEFWRWFGKASDGFKRSKLKQYVELAKLKDPNAGLFVYYSGHGAPSLDASNASSFLIPVDTTQEYISLEAYPVDTFYESIAALNAGQVTVVLDTCFSGNTERGLIFQGVSPGLLKTKPIKTPISLADASIFMSTSQDQVSYWHEKSKHSLFSYYFLKGMKGGADENKDGQLTTGELQNYINYEVKRYILTENKSSSQTPRLEGESSRVLFEYL